MDFIFITYILALIAFILSLYAIISIREVEKTIENKQQKNQPKKSLPPITVPRAKGHWD